MNSVYRKKTFSGLLTNFFSFTSLSYELGLIRKLLDRAYKLKNTLLGFNKEEALLHIQKELVSFRFNRQSSKRVP